MTEETTQVVTPDAQAAEGQPTAQEQPNTDQGTQWTPETAAAEIKALRAENAKHRTAAKAAETAKAKAEADALAKQGEYKTLYEQTAAKLAEYEPAATRLAEVMEMVQATNAKRLEAIPEGMRTLVPEYDDPLKLSAWLDANSAVLTKTPAPRLDGRAGGNSGTPSVTDEDVAEFANMMGIDPKYVDRAALSKLAR